MLSQRKASTYMKIFGAMLQNFYDLGYHKDVI